uniref:Uncharacterized protein n=1 Tax=Arundo donax TaxID=35708 RepID=A0A0A9DS15_ARUDO
MELSDLHRPLERPVLVTGDAMMVPEDGSRKRISERSPDSGSSSDEFFPDNLLPPTLFNDKARLKFKAIHHYSTAGELRESMRFDCGGWLGKKFAFAILSNPLVFCTTVTDDHTIRSHGLCYLVKTDSISDSIGLGCGYPVSESDSQPYTQETKVRQLQVYNRSI